MCHAPPPCALTPPPMSIIPGPQETLKSVVAQYNASQLLTMREVVSRDIRRTLTERASHFHIILEDVSITNLTFSKEYTAAVEAKQVAQQEAERAKFIVGHGRKCRAGRHARPMQRRSARLAGCLEGWMHPWGTGHGAPWRARLNTLCAKCTPNNLP